jgi:hypothetical protein
MPAKNKGPTKLQLEAENEALQEKLAAQEARMAQLQGA